jgi:DNA-binding response OmpR family regulator
MKPEQKIALLEEEVETLRARVEYLESTLAGTSVVFPLEWGPTVTEAKLMGALVSREILTKEAAMVLLYGDRPDDPPEEKIVDVLICKIRNKLEPFQDGPQSPVQTIWGVGFTLEKTWARRLQR